jgi:hypothetical protein
MATVATCGTIARMPMREPITDPKPLVCAECLHADCQGDGRCWPAYVVGSGGDGFGEPEGVLVYCPACSEREYANMCSRPQGVRRMRTSSVLSSAATIVGVRDIDLACSDGTDVGLI